MRFIVSVLFYFMLLKVISADEKYEVTFYTGDMLWAGTDANVYIAIHGVWGKSYYTKVPSTHSQMKKGGVDTFELLFKGDFGDMRKIKITHDNTGTGAGWFLDTVVLRKVTEVKKHVFTIKKWLDDGPPHTVTVLASLPDDMVQCGLKASSKVVNGDRTMPNEYPWQAQLVVPVTQQLHFCGATLIHPEWVLTAAHCVAKIPKDQYFQMIIKMGGHDIAIDEIGEVKRYVSDIIVHPKFGVRPRDSDVALIKLSRPVMLTNKIKLACLPAVNETVAEGSKCFVSGWGRLGHPGSMPNQLHHAQLPTVSYKQCDKAMSHASKITENMLCAGGNGKSGCHGDSGGPFVCPAVNGRYFIQGVVSWGSPVCTTKEGYSVFARVANFVNWIHSHINVNYV